MRSLALAGPLAMLALIALGPGAAADVTISPSTAEQGGAAAITLQVRNDRPGAFTKQVEVQFPQATPIAEVYPMSVPYWAPIATSRKLDAPVQGIHNDGLTIVTAAVTWIRADDAPKAPAVENLGLQLGPLPKIDELVLTVVQTYSDGTVRRWSGPNAAGAGVQAGNGTVLHLQPAGAYATPAVEDTLAPVATGQGNTAAQLGLIVAGIVVGVLASAMAVVTLGNRSRAERPAEDAAEEKADVVA